MREPGLPSILLCGCLIGTLSMGSSTNPACPGPCTASGVDQGRATRSWQAAPDWGRLSALPPGQEIVVEENESRRFPAAFVRSDAALLSVVDLSQVGDTTRRAIVKAVRGDASRVLVDGFVEVTGARALVVRVPRPDVARVSMTVQRSSATKVGVATAAAAVGGLFLGAYAGIAASGGLFSKQHEARGTAVALAIMIGLPVGVGFATYYGIRRAYTDVVYEAPSRTNGLSLDDAEWRALRRALPASLQER